MTITRQQIIDALNDELKKNHSIIARISYKKKFVFDFHRLDFIIQTSHIYKCYKI